ncbi:MAG: GtrA family protein [Proteobacteria bacterium]|nr:GtrA family protein [Pseudomonadota bacterium]
MKRFSKAQVSALAATAVDFGSLVLLAEKAGVPYPYGVASGAFAGAITNFFMNRHWSFEAHEAPIHGQAFRYFLVSGGSLLLNTFGVMLWTETFHLHYLGSKIVTAILVGILFNYPLHRDFVYRKGTV